MKNRILLGIALIIGLAVYFGVHRASETEQEKTAVDLTVIKTKPEKFKSITRKLGSETMLFEKFQGVWWMVQPLRDQLDESEFNQWVETVLTRKADQVVFKSNETFEQKEFGLQNPLFSFSIEDGDSLTKETVIVGAVKTFDGGYYVYNQKDKTLLALPNDWEANATRSFHDLRDRRIWRNPNTNVSRIELVDADAKFRYWLEKKDEKWSSSSPSSIPISNEKVDKLIQSLYSMRATGFENPAQLKPPFLEIRLKVQDEIITFQFFHTNTRKDIELAKIPGTSFFAHVPKAEIEPLRVGLHSLN